MNSCAAPSHASVVYCFREGDDGPVKIGVATNLIARHKQLQCGNPRPLMLVWSKPGDRAEERALHLRFKAHRLGGEWFSPAAEILDHAPRAPKDQAFVSRRSGAARESLELRMDEEWLGRAKRRAGLLAARRGPNLTKSVPPMWERES